MAELALVMGISDPVAFKKAMSEYKAIADDLLAKIRDKNPGSIPPEYQIPSPESETTADGTVYQFKLPEEAGLDAQIAPSGGVGPHVAVFATSPSLAARILAETPNTSQGLLAKVSGEPCATMFCFNWAALVDAATPWIEFAIRENVPGAEQDGDADSPQVADILSQVRSGLEILKCWKTTESVTTIENGVTIGHSVTTFKDLP